MNYTSITTSKGTITIPAPFRKQLGIQEGDVLEITRRGEEIVIRQKLDWDAFFSTEYDMGEKARKQIQKGSKKSLLTNSEIDRVIRTMRKGRHAKS